MAHSPAFAPRAGRRASVGPYRVLDVLGSGGMGVVYLAEHGETGERVALKTVRVTQRRLLSSIRREIHALRRIDHPGVVRIVADGLDGGVPWYAMELLEGRTLWDHLLGWGRRAASTAVPVRTDAEHATATVTVRLDPGLSVQDPGGSGAADAGAPEGGAATEPLGPGDHAPAVRLLRRACDTLAFVHGMGLVHRDLKPENIFIRADGTPVLVDFGLALAASGATGRDVLEVAGRPAGTPAYMAPEQIAGQFVDARADLYALGCILHTCLTGAAPFEGTAAAVLQQHLHAPPPRPSARAEGVPPALDDLVVRLLQKRPQDRLGYAEDVAVALAAPGGGGRRGGPRGRPYLYRPALAGRAAALGDVAASLGRARRGRGSRIFVGGESGVGKTRFAAEVATLATRDGLRVIAGQCEAVAADHRREAVRAAPLHPLRDLLHAVADYCHELGAEETTRLLGDHGPVLGAYEPAIARLPGQRDAELPALAPPAARARLLRALAFTVAALAEAEPLLLLVDDLQWADDSTLAFLESLDAAFFDRHPVVILCTYRSEEASDAVRAMRGAPGASSIELGRLDPPAVAGMVGDMLAMPAPPPGFVGFLFEASEGNPYFIAEYLRVAIDEGVLARDEAGTWRVAAGEADVETYRAALPLPRELRALVGRRFASLSAAAQAVARLGAVLGRAFDADVLSAAAALDEVSALEAIEELRARQIVEEWGGGLRFAHDKLREIIFAGIPAEERRARSAAAARAVEAAHAGTPELAVHYPFLAHAFADAGDHEKALAYLEKAGARALETGASADAAGFFRRAVEIDDARLRRGAAPATALRRASWERRLAHAELNLGRLHEARRWSEDALHRLHTGAARAGEPGPARTYLRLLGHLGRQALHLVRAAPRAPSADPEARRRLTETSLAAERLGEIYFFQGEPLRAFLAGLEAANAAEALGPSPELSRGYATLSLAFASVPLPRAVHAYEARARAAAEATGDPQTISWVCFMRTVTAIGEARWDDARAASDRAASLARAARDHRRIEECLALRNGVELMSGHFAESLRWSDELLDSVKKSGNRQGEVWALSTRIWVLICLGRADEAILAMEQAAPRFEADIGDRAHRVTAGDRALAHLVRGDLARARALASETLALIEGTRPGAFHMLPGYAVTCEVFLALYAAERDPAERRRLARDARSACRGMRRYARVFSVGRPAAARFDGLLHATEGRPARARRCFSRSLDEAERLAMPIEAAQARYELARLLPPRDPRRGALLERARRAFAERGAGYWLARAEAALAGGAQP